MPDNIRTVRRNAFTGVISIDPGHDGLVRLRLCCRNGFRVEGFQGNLKKPGTAPPEGSLAGEAGVLLCSLLPGFQPVHADICGNPATVPKMQRLAGKGDGMPLQNRVDPFGNVHAVQARGMFTGNRGVIHDPERRALLARRWTTRAWLICVCRYKDRTPREVMGYNGRKGGAGWTELFFLDEVTALAAGHRPCFFCRYEAARAYAGCFGEAFGIAAPKAPAMDLRLHRERRASGGAPVMIERNAIMSLPAGTMVAHGGSAYARHGRRLLHWGFSGWSPAGDIAAGDGWTIVTPPATVAVLRAGYRPIWHDSAERS